MSVHESLIPAAAVPIVLMQRRASAFGPFAAGYGIFCFAGSAIIGVLYDFSAPISPGYLIVLEHDIVG